MPGLMLLLACSSTVGWAQDTVDSATLKPLAGHWYVSQTEPPVYYFKDADRYLDLFSYHRKDSNKDGIENLRISHDKQHLIITDPTGLTELLESEDE